MIIKPHQWADTIHENLAPLYLISSAEPLLVDEAKQLLRTAAKAKGFTEAKILTVDKTFDWQQLTETTHNLSLFSDKQWLELRLPSGKPGDKGGKALRHYCDNPPSDTLLVIVAGKIDKASEKARWYQAINKVGHILTLWPPKAQQLPQWIQQQAEKKAMIWNKEACVCLAEHTEGNLLACTQTIEKMALLYGECTVNQDMVLENIHQQCHFSPFELVDTALRREKNRVCAILQNLQAEGTEPTVILWALTREIRSLARMAWFLSQGKNIPQAMQQERVWPQRQPLIKSALERHPLKKLHHLLMLAQHTDGLIKGVPTPQHSSDPWQALRQIALRLT
ncbi:MAG: DNA polymerase III subunit delta [Gammaproteobacteria bacterium]